MIAYSLFLIVSLFEFAAAYSTGLGIYTCEVTSPLGCPGGLAGYNKKLLPNGYEWVPNRASCNTTGRQMGWALAPVRSDNYRLWVGASMSAPVTSYQPDRLLTVKLATIKYETRFIGLMVYAVDAQNKKVGTWEFGDELPQVYRHPDVCDKNVLFQLREEFCSCSFSCCFRFSVLLLF